VLLFCKNWNFFPEETFPYLVENSHLPSFCPFLGVRADFYFIYNRIADWDFK